MRAHLKKNFSKFFMSGIQQYLQPEGPISYEQFRLYMLENGFKKPGKGMKNLIETAQNSGMHKKIGDGLKQIVSIMHENGSKKRSRKGDDKNGKKKLPKWQSSLSCISKSDVGVSDTTVGTEKVEAGVTRHLLLRDKPQDGNFTQKVKCLIDALDEELEDEEPPITFDKQ